MPIKAKKVYYMMRRLVIALTAIVTVMTAKAAGCADSLCVYLSWQSIFDQRADTVILNPEVEIRSPFDFDFSTDDKVARNMLKRSTVAVAEGDSVWYINSNWIKQNFKGDCSHFSRYVPLYFSAKIAFVQFLRNGPSFGGALLNILVDGFTGLDTGVGMGDMYNGKPAHFYHLDFTTMTVHKVDSDYLQTLLEAYPDLKRRYVMMKDYTETRMVNEYFLEYVNRLNYDQSVPFLF